MSLSLVPPLSGGFQYKEVAASNSAPVCVIYSTNVESLQITGPGAATVVATGVLNGKAAQLTFEALEDNVNGDWIRITARASGLLTIIYQQAGKLVKGDITVIGSPLTTAYARGCGTIRVNAELGTFNFSAQEVGSVVKGTIDYAVYGASNSSVLARPAVRICGAVTVLTVTGNTATLLGKGTLNGSTGPDRGRCRRQFGIDDAGDWHASCHAKRLQH